METWVLVQNPNPTPVTVDISFMTGEGERPGPQGYVVDAGRRVTFLANDYVTDYHVSAMVTSRGGGAVCERAMYGNGRAWAHASVGHARR